MFLKMQGFAISAESSPEDDKTDVSVKRLKSSLDTNNLEEPVSCEGR